MKKHLRVLHLEDNDMDAQLVKAALATGGLACDTTRVQSRSEFLTEIKRGAFDMILADSSLPSLDGMSALAIAKEMCPNVPFIIVSGALIDDKAIEALRTGAADLVSKDQLSRLAPSVRRVFDEFEQRARDEREHESLKKSEARFRSLCDSLPVSVLLTDGAGRCTYANAASLSLFGVNANQRLEEDWLRFVFFR